MVSIPREEAKWIAKMLDLMLQQKMPVALSLEAHAALDKLNMHLEGA